MIIPEPGFRAALGYEYRHFRFAVESGYTHISGNNPLVLDITLIPLTAKIGYNLPLLRGLGLQADLSYGVFFSQTVYYPSAIDMLQDKVQNEKVKSPLAGARLYATYTFLSGFMKLYAGGGVDIILETDGPIPPPVIEAGISIKPFSLLKHSEKQPLNAVHFQKNSTAMIEQYRVTLDEAGKRMKENPSLRITLRTYTPPAGDAEWQVRKNDGTPALSAARAGYCIQYLQERYGINLKRVKIEYKDAGKAADDAQRELFRRVELIIR
jgi:outer membrane protein OmpA-like peptidoglycan-associated protein